IRDHRRLVGIFHHRAPADHLFHASRPLLFGEALLDEDVGRVARETACFDELASGSSRQRVELRTENREGWIVGALLWSGGDEDERQDDDRALHAVTSTSAKCQELCK